MDNIDELLVAIRYLPVVPPNTEYVYAKQEGVVGEALKHLSRKGRKERDQARRVSTLMAAVAHIQLQKGRTLEGAWSEAQKLAEAGVNGCPSPLLTLVWVLLEMSLLWDIDVPQGRSTHPRHKAFRILCNNKAWWRTAADLQREIESLVGKPPFDFRGENGQVWVCPPKGDPVEIPTFLIDKKLLLILGREMSRSFSCEEEWQGSGVSDSTVTGAHVERARHLADAYNEVATYLRTRHLVPPQSSRRGTFFSSTQISFAASGVNRTFGFSVTSLSLAPSRTISTASSRTPIASPRKTTREGESLHARRRASASSSVHCPDDAQSPGMPSCSTNSKR